LASFAEEWNCNTGHEQPALSKIKLDDSEKPRQVIVLYKFDISVELFILQDCNYPNCIREKTE